MQEFSSNRSLVKDGRNCLKMQIQIYRNLRLNTWAAALENDSVKLTDIIFRNQKNVIEREAAGMIPIFMPGRKVQEKNWSRTITKSLKPYFRKDGQEWDFDLTFGYFSSTVDIWAASPRRSYICWTKPTDRVDSETMNKLPIEQRIVVQEKHHQYPQLYDATDMHPSEYIALQVMRTHEMRMQLPTNIDVIPLDYVGENNLNKEGRYRVRFVCLPLTEEGGAVNIACYRWVCNFIREEGNWCNVSRGVNVIFTTEGMGVRENAGIRLVGRMK